MEALDAHRKEKEADRRHIGELVRGATVLICNHQRLAKDRIKNPAEFWPMPWDEDDSSEARLKKLREMTPEERYESAQKLLDLANFNEDGISTETEG